MSRVFVLSKSGNWRLSNEFKLSDWMLGIVAANSRFSLDAEFIHITGIGDLSIHCQLIYGNNTLISVSLGYLFLIRSRTRQKRKERLNAEYLLQCKLHNSIEFGSR